MDLKSIAIVLTLGCVQSQFFEDRRCRCVCPNPASLLNTTNTRQIFTGNVPPTLCHCEGVVFPLLRAELEGKMHIFCPRCECIYQTRNTTLIMTIVCLILIGIVASLLYMASYTGLKNLIMRGRNHGNVDRYLERPAERDYIREHRGEFQRERDRQRQRELELERRLEQQQWQREREREQNRNRALRDGSPGSEEEDLLRAVEPQE